MNDLTILVDARRPAGGGLGIPWTQVDVRWEGEARPLPAGAAAHLEARWQAYLDDAQAQGKTLFNGPITRLIGAREVAGRVLLELGPSDYKTFLVTRVRDREWFSRHAPDAMARALGNSVLLTHNDQALLGIRAHRVSAYAGRVHLLGGVLDELGTQRFAAAARGLVDHLLLELQEEAAMEKEELASTQADAAYPRLLGLLQDEFLGQPEAAWVWETQAPLEQVVQRLDPREHSGGMLLTRGKMDEATWERMTPVARFSWRAWSDQ